MLQTHQIKPEDEFGWHLAQNLLSFGDTVKRKSTGLVITPDDYLTTFLTDEDKTAHDWQLVPTMSKE